MILFRVKYFFWLMWFDNFLPQWFYFVGETSENPPSSSVLHKTPMNENFSHLPLDLSFSLTLDPSMPKTAQNSVVLMPKNSVILGLKMVYKSKMCPLNM
jgi:hypothetical protein